MKYSSIFVCGLGGMPICPTFETANIVRPITTGMMKSGSGRDRSGSHKNGTPRNSIVLAKTKNSANSTGNGRNIGRQPPNGLTLYSL